MVNFNLNAGSLLGILLAFAGVGLYFLRSFRPNLARDYDVFFAAVALLCGGILFFHSWRLDPILQFGVFLLTGSSVFFATDSIRLRSVTTEQAKRNTPLVDEDRPVSRVYRYESQFDDAPGYDSFQQDRQAPLRRIRGSADSVDPNYRSASYGEGGYADDAYRASRDRSRSSGRPRSASRGRPSGNPNSESYPDAGYGASERSGRPPQRSRSASGYANADSREPGYDDPGYYGGTAYGDEGNNDYGASAGYDTPPSTYAPNASSTYGGTERPPSRRPRRRPSSDAQRPPAYGPDENAPYANYRPLNTDDPYADANNVELDNSAHFDD